MMLTKNKLNILNILHLPWNAGTEMSFVATSKSIAQYGHNLTCLIPKESMIKNNLESIHSSLNIIENNKTFKNLGKFDLKYILQLKKIIKDKKIDVAIANNGRNTEILKIAAKNLCPVVAINHGTNQKKTAKADFLLAVTSNMANSHIKYGMDKNKILNFSNMIEMNNLENVQPSKITNQIPVIGVIGRLANQKGIDIFLYSLKILKDNGVKFRAKIGGDGEDKQKLADLCKSLNLDNEVEFCGWVTDKESFFSGVDVFCLSSREEAFGIVLLEAMKYRTPIVATDCDGPTDVITHLENGYLVEKQNPKALAEGLKFVINNEELKIKFADNGYKKLIENYTEEVVGKKIEDALQFIINNK